LLRALVDAGVDLAHNTARMAASEAHVVLFRLGTRLALFAAGLMVATVGLLLCLVAAALAVAQLTGVDRTLAFAAVGSVTLAGGAVFAIRAIRRLGEPDLAFPATLAELQADVEMLRSGRDRSGNGTP
jgi:uncharacterized membrane protein YqjE